MTIHNQLERIKRKLKDAAKVDANHQLFGANSHQYRLHEPLGLEELREFEQKHGIVLPAEYAAFLTNIGNGGAGPYYGIHPLGEKQSIELGRMDKPSSIRPELTKEQWKADYPALHDDSNISDEQYEEEQAKAFQGLLNIGEQGCTYETMLMITGEHRGKVVYIDLDYQKPVVTFEANFLDWYERWLDEIIAGYETSWFGMRRGGDERELTELYQSTLDESVKLEALNGMFKLKNITAETIAFLVSQYESSSNEVSQLCLQILAKKNFAEAARLIHEELTSSSAENRLCAIQAIHWYMPKGDQQFNEELISMLPAAADAETFRFICYILHAAEVEMLPMLLPFFTYPDVEIRVHAVYQAGQSSKKGMYASELIQRLDDSEVRVKLIALQALTGIIDPALLPIYERLLERHQTDKDYIRSNVLRRLEEFQFKSKKQMDKLLPSSLVQVRALLGKHL
ncbi:SMI1/KNR4 family protein [Paenibacillus sp. Leaf72]|uniref:SMI1/KNR4 family protein n=1 Tax=Paenibacillus sp. Leaf72 TaxID=1736234 RepID=UPI0006F9753B|nr:SMI1/KNR4 family protein [Paenibacillus sp. Leaf72]KQO18789.1 hypothetical protein ASF12_01675 [Paenibacillus sp. Leaf72]